MNIFAAWTSPRSYRGVSHSTASYFFMARSESGAYPRGRDEGRPVSLSRTGDTQRSKSRTDRRGPKIDPLRLL